MIILSTSPRRAPESHSHSDVASLLHHGRREHSVNANAGEHNRKSSEDAHEKRIEAALPEVVVENVLHGQDVEYRQVLVERRRSAV